jgi:hypothetical protein
METRKNQNAISILFLALIIPLLFFSCTSSKKVVQLNGDDVRNMVDSSRFDFIAERVNPLRGSTRYLTSPYDVIVKKDSVVCYLPFFGRAYQAPVDLSKGGIEFTSTNFSYQSNSKDQSWDVLIKPNDYQNVQQLLFNISANGTATLNVVNTNRDPISFYGYIQRVKK